MIYLPCGYDGNGRKNPETYNNENKRKKFPVWLPSHVYEIRGRLFSGSKKPKTNRTYPMWDGGPNLLGQRNTGSGAVFGSICSTFVWVLWHINHCRLFNAKSILIQIKSSISNYSLEHKYTVCQRLLFSSYSV